MARLGRLQGTLCPQKQAGFNEGNEVKRKIWRNGPILGISKPVIKAHGSSDAKAFKNAIRQAIEYAGSGAVYEVAMAAQEYAARKKALREAAHAQETSGSTEAN